MRGYRPGPVAVFFALLVGVFLLMPLLAVVPVSFTPARMLSMPTGALSLRHYRTLIEDPRWLDAILLSLRVGLVASTLATLLALTFSLGVWMFRPRFASVMVGFVLLPMIVPPVVSAITIYFLLTSMSGVGSAVGYDTWLGVVLAHVVVTTPFAVVLILVSLSQIDRRIDLAARGLGASPFERATKVIIPNIKFGIATAWLLSFVLSWEEIGVTLFITSVNAITLPRLMWMGLRDNIDPAIAAISVILILMTVTVMTVRVIYLRAAERRSKRLA